MVWGSLIGAGASIIGGALASGASGASNSSNEAIMAAQLAFQREMAQNGIRWKVEDAKAAGIHPIYALGAPPFNPSPVAIANQPDTGWANALSEAGQHIGRAVDSTKTQEEKVDAHTQTMRELQLQNAALQNKALETDIQFKQAEYGAIIGRSSFGQPFPDPHAGRNPAFVDSGPPSNTGSYRPFGSSPAATATGLVDPKPHQPVIRDPSRPHQEPGDITDTGWARTPTGWTPVPSKDVKERIEDSLVSETLWEMRNRIPPTFQGRFNPPFPAPPGKVWSWSSWKQEYQLIDSDKVGNPNVKPGRNSFFD